MEDTRQLGGDAVVRAGVVLRLFRARGPDTRAPAREIVAALTDAAHVPEDMPPEH